MGDFRRFFYNPFVRTGKWIAFILSVMALIDLAINGFNFTVTDWLTALLKEYELYSELAWKQLEPLARYLVQYLNNLLWLPITLNSWWKSFWTPQVLYAVSVAGAAWTAYHARSLQIVYLVAGFLVFFLSSVAASNWSLTSYSVWPMVIIGVGFAIFHLIGVTWQIRFRSNPNAPPTALLRFVIAYPLGNLGIVFTIAIGSVLIVPLPVVAQVLLAVTFMGVRDLLAGAWGATFERSADKSWRSAFFGYGTTVHGLMVLAALAAAAGTIMVAVLLRWYGL